uniref:immunity protein Imm33 domain-containing protein n=1 Tax=Thaumasiovibrio occultus TaxID=1891184 RepID=UPI000B34C266|nr:hypothetical protein [Thaumasiovibrio occultus]
MEYKTTGCARAEHPEFVLCVDDPTVPQADIKHIIHYLESSVMKGTRYFEGQHVQIGFMLLKVAKDGDCLRLFEPKLKSMPLEFINSVSLTLKFLRQQLDTVLSVEGQHTPVFCWVQESIIISKNALLSQEICLTREEKEAHHSGWFLRDMNEQEVSDIEQMSLFDFAGRRPDLVKYLALPVGMDVITPKGTRPRILQGQMSCKIIDGSYLDKLYTR